MVPSASGNPSRASPVLPLLTSFWICRSASQLVRIRGRIHRRAVQSPKLQLRRTGGTGQEKRILGALHHNISQAIAISTSRPVVSWLHSGLSAYNVSTNIRGSSRCGGRTLLFLFHATRSHLHRLIGSSGVLSKPNPKRLSVQDQVPSPRPLNQNSGISAYFAMHTREQGATIQPHRLTSV